MLSPSSPHTQCHALFHLCQKLDRPFLDPGATYLLKSTTGYGATLPRQRLMPSMVCLFCSCFAVRCYISATSVSEAMFIFGRK